MIRRELQFAFAWGHIRAIQAAGLPGWAATPFTRGIFGRDSRSSAPRARCAVEDRVTLWTPEDPGRIFRPLRLSAARHQSARKPRDRRPVPVVLPMKGLAPISRTIDSVICAYEERLAQPRVRAPPRPSGSRPGPAP